MLRIKELQEANIKTKQELVRIKTAFQKEIGEDVNIESVLNKDTWKGRAQQIVLLKSKVKELQRQLEMDKPKEVTAAAATVVASQAAAGEALNTSLEGDASQQQQRPASPATIVPATQTKEVKSVDDKTFELLEKLDKETKLEVSELRKQVAQKMEELKQMKKKNEAASARIKILESSNADMKSKFAYVKNAICLHVGAS